MVRVQKRLSKDYGREATITEVADELSLPVDRVESLLKVGQQRIASVVSSGDNPRALPAQVITFSDPDEIVRLKREVQSVLETLTERERQILEQRFGLVDGYSRTLDEVGKQFDVTRERVRQIEAKALRKVGKSSTSEEWLSRIQGVSAVVAATAGAFTSRSTKPQVVLPELHDGDTGRIDAQKVAEFISVPLKSLCDALGLNYKAVHRNPSASSSQEALRPVKRTLEYLYQSLGKPETVRAWLNTPHPMLEEKTALETILAGNVFALERLLGNAWDAVVS